MMKRPQSGMKKQMGNSRSTQEDEEESARTKSMQMEEKMKSNELVVVKKASQTTTWEFDIPMDVITNILFKSPPQFIYESFRYVSKQFNSLVSTPHFAHQNFAYSKPKFILHHPHKEFPQNAPTYEMEDGEFVPSGHFSRSGVLINSCNGLLLIESGITLQVTNPITKKIVSLPDCPSNCKHDYFCLCFLAFDSSSNLFKVIHGSSEEYNGFEIWSLGVDSAWRNVHPFVDDESISMYYSRSVSSHPVCIRGRLHWLETCRKFLLSMDVNDETANSTPLPHTGEPIHARHIMEMGECLAYIATASSGTTIYIWMFKDLMGEWIHQRTILSCSVNWDVPTPVPTSDLMSFTPLLSTNNGNILIFKSGSMLYSYDIASGWLKKLRMMTKNHFNIFLVHRDSLISWDAPDKLLDNSWENDSWENNSNIPNL